MDGKSTCLITWCAATNAELFNVVVEWGKHVTLMVVFVQLLHVSDRTASGLESMLPGVRWTVPRWAAFIVVRLYFHCWRLADSSWKSKIVVLVGSFPLVTFLDPLPLLFEFSWVKNVLFWLRRLLGVRSRRWKIVTQMFDTFGRSFKHDLVRWKVAVSWISVLRSIYGTLFFVWGRHLYVDLVKVIVLSVWLHLHLDA